MAPQIETATEISEYIQAPGIGQIPGEVIQSDPVSSQTHILILFGVRKNCLSSGKSTYYYTYLHEISDSLSNNP